MFLWWGPELVQIFNDGYLPSFGGGGRDIAALGARGREHWAEIWDIIGPQIEGVMTRGEATWHEDHLVPITRNGAVEDVYWTYGYSPVRDDDGRIAGVLVVVQETTSYVKAQAERELLLQAEHEARVDAERARAEALVATQQLQRAFSQAPPRSPSRWDRRINSFWRTRDTSNSSAGRSRSGGRSETCFRRLPLRAMSCCWTARSRPVRRSRCARRTRE